MKYAVCIDVKFLSFRNGAADNEFTILTDTGEVYKLHGNYKVKVLDLINLDEADKGNWVTHLASGYYEVKGISEERELVLVQQIWPKGRVLDYFSKPFLDKYALQNGDRFVYVAGANPHNDLPPVITHYQNKIVVDMEI